VPELPEVETIAAGVNAAIAGERITRVAIPHPDVLREATAATLQRRLRDRVVIGAARRAKHIVVSLDSGDSLVVQPRFTGKLLVGADATLDPADLRYTAVRFALGDTRALYYADVRRLGTVALMSRSRLAEYFGSLGLEPLSREFTASALSGILRASRQPVKKVIMDQYRIVGVGNIYANEALWRARIDPSRAASRVSGEEAATLRDSIVAVLTEAIAQRGTSFRDYRDAGGEAGGFVEFLAAYGRAGEPCRRCGARLAGTHAIDGRQTVLCARCQR